MSGQDVPNEKRRRQDERARRPQLARRALEDAAAEEPSRKQETRGEEEARGEEAGSEADHTHHRPVLLPPLLLLLEAKQRASRSHFQEILVEEILVEEILAQPKPLPLILFGFGLVRGDASFGRA